MWIKGGESYGESDHQNLHRIAIAFISDMLMVRLILDMYPRFQAGLMTSLDHSMWFHRTVNAESWHLCDAQCEESVEGRSLNSTRLVPGGEET